MLVLQLDQGHREAAILSPAMMMVTPTTHRMMLFFSPL